MKILDLISTMTNWDIVIMQDPAVMREPISKLCKITQADNLNRRRRLSRKAQCVRREPISKSCEITQADDLNSRRRLSRKAQ